MGYAWTVTQKERLSELGAEVADEDFASAAERDKAFFQQEKELKKAGRQRLEAYRQEIRRPGLCKLREKLAAALVAKGFVEVATPTIISRQMLAKMTIDDEHELFSQVFWLDKNKCLRPMLAPNLYYVSKDLLRLWKEPMRIFEIGSCFRKESQGSTHLNEFTMLNLVEWGVPMEERTAHLAEFAKLVMETAGLPDYELEQEDSVVYGDTMDVTYHGIEVASSAMGPHPLDGAWGITTTWAGIGFGLERLLMLREGGRNVKSYGRSITYLDGTRLNL